MKKLRREILATATSEKSQADAWEHEDRLIRWMLDLSPAERLATLQDYVNGMTVLKNGRRLSE